MNSIKVLDVTLRDGGCVNNFNFGQNYMERILAAQEAAHIDIIEMGYIDEKNGSINGRTQFINEQVIDQYFLKHKDPDISYVAMMDYGKFNVDTLRDRTINGIDGIRLAFHKKNYKDMIPLGRKIMEKGYELYIQPMITLRYSDQDLLELLEEVNHQLSDASGFYIVDSFGEMRPNDMNRILNLVDHNLIPSMMIGFHSHNNLQMSYSNAVTLLQFPTNRNIVLDGSIMGMGKGAGNLNTELLVEHLNFFYGKKYNVAPLLEVMDKVVNQLHSEFYWGYSPEYYLSAVNHCTPSYASHFYNKHMLPIDQVGELLSLIDEDKKISFDKVYAEKLYYKYNARKAVNDQNSVDELKYQMMGKEVLLVAPGKSIKNAKEKIKVIAAYPNVMTISLNLFDFIEQDFVIATRKDVFENALKKGIDLIALSSISKGVRGNVKILNYDKWVNIGEKTYDSSSVIAFNLLRYCGVKKIYMAGFDGFSVGINDNYYDPLMRFPVKEKEADEKNRYYTKLIKQMSMEGMDIKFITPSKYENY